MSYRNQAISQNERFSRCTDDIRLHRGLECSGELPHSFADFFIKNLSQLGPPVDITNLVHRQREVKSAWELEMKEAAKVQYRMFKQ